MGQLSRKLTKTVNYSNSDQSGYLRGLRDLIETQLAKSTQGRKTEPKEEKALGSRVRQAERLIRCPYFPQDMTPISDEFSLLAAFKDDQKQLHIETHDIEEIEFSHSIDEACRARAPMKLHGQKLFKQKRLKIKKIVRLLFTCSHCKLHQLKGLITENVAANLHTVHGHP